MNKQIRKKKEKQMLTWIINELVAGFRKEEEQRQAAIRQAAATYAGYLDEVMKRQH